ncbi:hypothetical protein OSB04_008229 [Centaurea solstitialis]|uniref:Uncharacterized protein n=1 Tax=Centaurea solstitialis TaxID=347529 RepID=A0AA38TLE3_9ASTR|nr:hypothetical protein OSB04_008229 [Centaurea solstitialis]
MELQRYSLVTSKKDNVTIEHYYRVNLFIAVIDSSSNIDDACKLVKPYYSLDFTEQEKIQLKLELHHYELVLHNHPQLKNACTLCELCRGL